MASVIILVLNPTTAITSTAMVAKLTRTISRIFGHIDPVESLCTNRSIVVDIRDVDVQ